VGTVSNDSVGIGHHHGGGVREVVLDCSINPARTRVYIHFSFDIFLTAFPTMAATNYMATGLKTLRWCKSTWPQNQGLKTRGFGFGRHD